MKIKTSSWLFIGVFTVVALATATYFLVLPPSAPNLPAPIALAFDATPEANAPKLEREPPNPELAQLWGVQASLMGAKNDFERARRVMKWTHDRFDHDGGNAQPTWSPAEVLKAAAEEKASFACTEFGKVLASALNAVGIPARVLSLSTSDRETRSDSAGHVLTEAYLRDQKRWVILDAQFDVAPTVQGQPVNAVELQKAILLQDQSLEVKTNSTKYSADNLKDVWLGFVSSYLYHFKVPVIATPWDQKVKDQKIAAGRHTFMMLVPKGAKNPTQFQNSPDASTRHTFFTHSLATFYREP